MVGLGCEAAALQVAVRGLTSTCQEVRLRGRCVDGLLQCGEVSSCELLPAYPIPAVTEVELAVDLADAWGVGIPEAVRHENAERAKAEAAAEAALVHLFLICISDQRCPTSACP